MRQAIALLACSLVAASLHAETSFIWKFSHHGIGPSATGAGNLQLPCMMPDIIKLSNGTYRMYFGVSQFGVIPPPAVGVKTAIKSATSPDGLNWTVEAGYRIVGSNGAGSDGIDTNETYIAGPRVVALATSGHYRIYYQANTSYPVSGAPPDFRVKTALSTDGGLTFVRDVPSNTVVDCPAYASPTGVAGQFALAGHCSVIRFSDTDFRIFVSGNYSKPATGPSDLVMGSSSDGLNFGSFSVLYTGCHDSCIVPLAAGGYRMFFGDQLTRQRTAYSADGKTWPATYTETVLYDASGAEVTENSVPTPAPMDRAAVELASGEIVLYPCWTVAVPADLDIAVMRQQAPAQPPTDPSDTDGDGFANELETALGTNPNDAASTPFGGSPAGTPQDLVIGKMQIKLDFAKANNDRINIQGTLPVADGFNFANQVVVFDVGGVVKSFTLDAKGKSPSGANDSVKLNKPKGGVAKYIVKFNKGSFAANLADEGLVGTADAKNAPKDVTVVALFNSTLLRTTKTLSYTAKANKGGLAK